MSCSGVEFDSRHSTSVPSTPTSSARTITPECVHFEPSTHWISFDAGNVPCISTMSPVCVAAVASSNVRSASATSVSSIVGSGCSTTQPGLRPCRCHASRQIGSARTDDVMRIVQHAGPDVVVVGENENLVVWQIDRADPIATAPNLACWIDGNGRATTTSDLVADPSLHADVTLLGLRSDDRLWSPTALARFVDVLTSVGYWGPPVRTPIGD